MALLLATFAAWPFLTRSGLPVFTDAEQHVYRAYEVMEAWKAGVLYPRWAPDLFYAFGYPVFHYYAPLTYHLAAAYGFVFGGPLAGMKFVLVSAAYLGAAGMYLFGRDRWGGEAGVIAAAAFGLAPYVVYIDPHARGAVPETFAIGLAPVMLWAFARLRISRAASPGNLIFAALMLAALTLSHNLMAFVFLGLLAAWLAWEALVGEGSDPAHRASGWLNVIPPGAAILLGLGLSAFMWLPAILERGAVQYQTLSSGYFDFHNYFIRARELLAPSLIFDLGATQMRFNHNLGVAPWLLAALGALSMFSARRRWRSVLFFALAALALIFLMTPSSVSVWETFPIIAFLQFPTRLLGPAAVVLGILAGASASWADTWRSPWSHAVFGAAAVAACLAGAMPLLNLPPWGDFGPVNPQRIFKTERDGRGVGTTSGNEFLPVGVTVVPGPRASLWDSYAAEVVDKINRATLPEAATVTVVEHGPEHDRFRVSSQTPFVLRPYTFYWPGWTAYVDGVKTPIEIADPDGWITFWVPAGTHDVRLRLEDTPPRGLGWGVSGLALLALIGLGAWGLRARPASTSAPVMLSDRSPEAKPLSVGRETLRFVQNGIHGPPATERLEWRHALIFAAVILGGMAVRVAADRAGGWLVRSTGNAVLVAQHPRFARLEGDVALLAYDLPEASARPGDQLPVTLYWKAMAPLQRNLRVFVHFIGPDGELWGQSDKWNPADFPMNGWPLDHYVRDEHNARLRPDAPPGAYTVNAGLYEGDTGVRMRVLDASGAPTEADGVVLTTTFVVRP